MPVRNNDKERDTYINFVFVFIINSDGYSALASKYVGFTFVIFSLFCLFVWERVLGIYISQFLLFEEEERATYQQRFHMMFTNFVLREVIASIDP